MEEGSKSTKITESGEKIQPKEQKGPRRANVEVEFDSNKKKFNDLKRSNAKDLMKRWRVDIMRQTMDISYAQNYILSDGTVVALGDSTKDISKNVFYINEHLTTLHDFAKTEIPSEHDTVIQVENMDCIELGIDLIQKSFNPVILNMASHKRPGGGYMTGAGAQEENIFRRSNYFQHLQGLEKKYPMYGAVYSPNVVVFRSNEDPDGYALLKSPIRMSFVAVAAFAHPRTIDVMKNGIKIKELDKEAATKTKQKIRYILDVALYHKHDSVVLSAFGCGAFANPPGHMARLFREVINTEYKGKFKYIGFAILDDANAQRNNAEGNFKPFYNVFNEK